MINGILSLKETIERLVTIRKELAATKTRKRGKRVKPTKPQN
jgi:hypothetical protein